MGSKDSGHVAQCGPNLHGQGYGSQYITGVGTNGRTPYNFPRIIISQLDKPFRLTQQMCFHSGAKRHA